MKRWLPLLVLALVGCAAAPSHRHVGVSLAYSALQYVDCLPLTPCTPTGPQGTTGDPAYVAFGKVNANWGLLQPVFGFSVSDSPASSVNNYAPTGYIGGTTTRLLVTAASGGTTITGLSSSGVPDGFSELLCDQSTTDVLILPNQSSSSSSGNQWLNAGAGSVTIAAGACVPVTLVVSNWRVLL